MVEHTKGATSASETARVMEAWAALCATVYAYGDLPTAWAQANALGDLARELQSQSLAFKGHLLRRWASTLGMTHQELADLTGLTRGRVSQFIAEARTKGNPVPQPTRVKIKPPVVLSVITDDADAGRLLVVYRHDKTPPVSFPGGEYEQDETIHDTAVRRVEGETGLKVIGDTLYIGERIHPATRRHMIYVHASVEVGDPTLGDPEDLSDVRWLSIAEALPLMGDMFPPVKDYLLHLQAAHEDD